VKLVVNQTALTSAGGLSVSGERQPCSFQTLLDARIKYRTDRFAQQ